jgi:hypothetical protein
MAHKGIVDVFSISTLVMERHRSAIPGITTTIKKVENPIRFTLSRVISPKAHKGRA